MIETALPSSELAKKRKRLFLFSALATLIVASFLFFYWLLIWRFEEYTNDAYVSGNMVELTPQVAGIISSIRADDTDLVEESQVVIELDKTDLALAFEQRKAELGQSVRKVAQMFLTVEKLKAELLVKEAMRTKAQEDFQNRVDIVALGAVSKEEFEHVVAALDEAKASYDASKQSLDRAVAMIVNTRIPTHPLVEQAKEMIKRAWVDLNRTRILSPVNGYVAKRGGQLGEWAFPSKPLLAGSELVQEVPFPLFLLKMPLGIGLKLCSVFLSGLF
ncbi:MAG: hypothetical protein HYZ47_01340 [Simkania negevensis]|nr:hypothetical protein [Simkania negevensis]